MRQWIESPLVEIMACRSLDPKPSSKSMLAYCHLRTNFSEILIKIQDFLFMKMHLKISSAKWRPCCPLGISLKIYQSKYINTESTRNKIIHWNLTKYSLIWTKFWNENKGSFNLKFIKLVTLFVEQVIDTLGIYMILKCHCHCQCRSHSQK